MKPSTEAAAGQDQVANSEFFRQLPIVDAHHHFWSLNGDLTYPWLEQEPWLPFRYGDYAAIRRDYLPADYARDAAGHNIVATVHMEAEVEPGRAVDEIRWLAQLGQAAPSAAIAQIWLDRADVASQIAALASQALVRAVRHKPQAMPRESARRGAAGSMDDQAWRDGYALLEAAGLHFELQTPFWHLDAATELARDFPGTKLALNHCGLPADRSEAGLQAWRAALEALADCGNTYIKLSGIGLHPGIWPRQRNIEILQTAIEVFGPRRSMFASNFPVDRLCVDMDTMWTAYKQSVVGMSEADIRALFAGTASELYRLQTGR